MSVVGCANAKIEYEQVLGQDRMKMKTRIGVLLLVLGCVGCANPVATTGFYSYPTEITKRCHLKIEEHKVTIIVLDDKVVFTYPCRYEEGKIVVLTDKEAIMLTPQPMQVTDQYNRVFPKVISKSRISELEEVIRGSSNKAPEATR